VMTAKKGKEIERSFSVEGSPYIGIFAACTESLLLLPLSAPANLAVELGRALKVAVIKTYIADTSLIGCLVMGNSNGFVVSQYTQDSEIERIIELATEEGFEVNINRLPDSDRLSAAGNIILANDTVALVHPSFSEEAVEVVKDTLEVEVYKGKTILLPATVAIEATGHDSTVCVAHRLAYTCVSAVAITTQECSPCRCGCATDRLFWT